MIELIKKTLLVGIGAAVLTKDKIEETLEDFVREGRVTAADARKMAEKLAAQGKKEFRGVCSEVAGKLHETVQSTARARRPARTRRRPARK